MEEHVFQHWQVLHRRNVMGEILNAAERAVYEAGCREMDAGEALNGNLEQLRILRRKIVEADAKQQQLRQQETELDARIAALEARLAPQTRQQLGIDA